jgi:hypothetical protein
MIHPRAQEIFFDARASIGEENPEFLVREPSSQVFSNLGPIRIDPEADWLKTEGD